MDHKQRKLTTNADEAELSKLLSGDSVYEVPYFQRPYKWKPVRLRKLEEDILNIVDGRADSHFMGAIIIHGKKSNPSDPRRFEVIDGQQRITTVFLYLCSVIKILCKADCYDEAVGLYQKYIAIGRNTSLISNVKLHPSGEDRSQLNVVLSDMMADVLFQDRIGSFKPVPLPNTGRDKGVLISNYRSACRFMESQLRQAGVERIRDIYTALLEFVSVVQIDIYDPASAPKIFDSLNSRQEPMTIGDLIRNDIFSRAADKDYTFISLVDRDEWQPFYQKFQVGDKNYFEDYFFPFGLIHNANVSKSEVFNDLRNRWKQFDSPSAVISDLRTYQDGFLDILCATNLQGHPSSLFAAFRRVSGYGAPVSTFPFLMRLSQAAKVGEVEATVATAVVDVVENFLVRRAICGIEPTGLHAVFKRLWGDCLDAPTASNVKAAIQEHLTVVWPSDDDVLAAVKGRPLAASLIRYFVSEYDRSLGGDQPGDMPWIEHVLPQTYSQDWAASFSPEEHRVLLGLAANLIPLSSKMNIQLSNGCYAGKRTAYASDAMYKSARAFADAHVDWNPVELAKRGAELAAWATTRWPA